MRTTPSPTAALPTSQRTPSQPHPAAPATRHPDALPTRRVITPAGRLRRATTSLIIAASIVMLLLTSPGAALAQTPPPPTTAPPPPPSAPPPPPSLDTVLKNATNWLVALLASLATLFLTVGGIRYMGGAADPGEVEKAKTAVKAAAVGYALAALAPLAVTILKSIVGV